ncbi:unnamed protein product [Dovyalis caffra]|uniref:Polyprotein n=1 Tax=Dovyalis caffra TaxID=77055 RepID=A0AAV1SDQ2_9ROSI|nr:unnamed protein product [Dovyalis caffra]
MDRLDALSIDANRNRNDDGPRSGEDVARGQAVNGLAPSVHGRRQQFYDDDSGEDEYFEEPMPRRVDQGRLLDFMRSVERNDLREIEGQQVARYLEGLKLVIGDKIRVHVIRTLSEARNMATKGRTNVARKRKADYSRRSYGGDNYKTSNDKNKVVRFLQHTMKGLWKRKPRENEGHEVKDGRRAMNPYTKLIVGKCFKCNQFGHRSSDPLEGSMWWSEMRKMVKYAVKPMETTTNLRRMVNVKTMW